MPPNGAWRGIVNSKIERFEHTSLTIDEDRYLRLVAYAKLLDQTP